MVLVTDFGTNYVYCTVCVMHMHLCIVVAVYATFTLSCVRYVSLYILVYRIILAYVNCLQVYVNACASTAFACVYSMRA